MAYTVRTLGLFTALTLLFVAIGWLLGTLFLGDWVVGASIFLILALAMNLISYFFSKQIVLRSYRAKIVSQAEAPVLHRIVSEIAMQANMPMPEIAIVPTATPNAFATGRNPKDAVVAVTQGLLKILNEEELKGVLAHEMAHIKNRDILVMSVAATIAGAISFAARFVLYGSVFGGSRDNPAAIAVAVLAAITAPIAAMLVQLGISRSREYKADATGAQTIENPRALANALKKLEAANSQRPIDIGNPASAHMFIVNPFRGGGIAALFSTHPPMEMRIKKLEEMEGRMGYYY
ncbi:MAG: heat shock protein HtpX [Candidatus Methanomethylophilaceae archaeon]|nr:heat shock protein HtpX [Candidatus Methanomethylophilaceae archaeon]MDI3541297.1 heat shock protein HtpX [Candidatus Methanomethylophilaceae archaeon]